MYLWISTLEWVLGGIYLWLMLKDWEVNRFRNEVEGKKCPADGHFGVAQSPEPPLSETL